MKYDKDNAKHSIVAAGKVVKPGGYLPNRIVLRAYKDAEGRVTEFVVHVQGFTEDGKSSFCHGSYFPVRGNAATTVMSEFEKAYAKFQERDREKVIGKDFGSVFAFEQDAEPVVA